MSTFDFFTSLVEGHLIELLVCIFFAFFLYVLLYRRLYVSILDPFTISAILSLCGCGVVLFLYCTESIKLKYFISYILTQIAFFIGVLSCKSSCHKKRSKTKFSDEYKWVKLAYMVVVPSVVVCQLLVYKNVGIPIFLESRLEVSTSGGGVGILLRIINVWGGIALFLSFYFLEKTHSYKLIASFYITFSIIVAILSGAKSSFWNLISMLFLYAMMFSPKLCKKLKEKERLLLLLGIAAASFVILIDLDVDPLASLGMFLERFIVAGDVYWETYPSGYIEALRKGNVFDTVFVDIVSAYRIIPFKELPESMGIEIYRLHTDTDILVGPNPRHNIMGYVLWGMYGSVIFSFILGRIVGLVRNLFFSIDTYDKSVFEKIFVGLCYNVIWGLESDASFTVGKLHSIFMMSIFLSFVLFMIVSFFFFLKKYSSIALFKHLNS